MTSIPKTYEGTKYVSHTVERVELRRSPTNRWLVDVKTKTPPKMPVLPFNGFFDIPVNVKETQVDTYINKFAEGMRKRWQKRTSEDDSWIDQLKADLKKAVNES